MSASALLKASGLWEEYVTQEAIHTVSAYYRRPWADRGRCSLDDLCLYCAETNTNPEHMLNMLIASGELKEDGSTPKEDE